MEGLFGWPIYFWKSHQNGVDSVLPLDYTRGSKWADVGSARRTVDDERYIFPRNRPFLVNPFWPPPFRPPRKPVLGYAPPTIVFLCGRNAFRSPPLFSP